METYFSKKLRKELKKNINFRKKETKKERKKELDTNSRKKKAKGINDIMLVIY